MQVRPNRRGGDSQFLSNLAAVHSEAIPLLEHPAKPIGDTIEDVVEVGQACDVRRSPCMADHLDDRCVRSLPRPLLVEETIAEDPLQPGIALVLVHAGEGLCVAHRAEERLLDQVVGSIERLAQTERVAKEPIPRCLEQIGDGCCSRLLDEHDAFDPSSASRAAGRRRGGPTSISMPPARTVDTLHAGPPVKFRGIPRFAPEFFARAVLKDPTRRKHLQSGLRQLSQEGTVQLFYREGLGSADPYLGAVGLLQFEVLKERLKNEYRVKAELEMTPFRHARWVAGEPSGLAWLQERSDFLLVNDRDERPVVLTKSPWPLNYALQEAKGLELLDVSPL